MQIRFISLRTKLVIAFAIFILLPIFGTSLYAYSEFENILRKQIEVSASDQIQQINWNIDRKLKLMMNAANSIILDENIRELLDHPPRTMRQKLDASHLLNNKFMEISTTVILNAMDFTILDSTGNLYTSWSKNERSLDEITTSEWYARTWQENGFMLWTLNNRNYVRPGKEKLITVSMVIKDESFSRSLGMLAISEPVSSYIDILKTRQNSALGGYGFLVGPEGEIVGENESDAGRLYGEAESRIQSNTTLSMDISNKTYVVSSYTIDLSGWKIIHIVPHESIFQQVDAIRFVVSVTLIVSLTLFISLIILFSYMLTKPLRHLRTVMEQVERGNLDVHYDIHSRDEVALLGGSFNRMVRRLKSHIEKEIILEQRKEQARLEALQAQINPHFLHNTLSTIRWMSIMAGAKPITEMLQALGQLLDMSIHRGQEEIPLSEELENVRCFLIIQKHRFGDHIRIIEEIEPRSLEALVPKLSLQPLIENVYHHGDFTNRNGEIILRSLMRDGIVVLEVIDNGLSARSAEQSDRLNQERKQTIRLSGIGLNNVHSRVNMMYGKNFGLKIRHYHAEGRTCVSITLPFRKEDGYESDRS
ncbi:sensor histidine kinase [Paenibacillaceae bacterium WGS1546]|uniref:sensor histidine kinase n=1 Tax=Cohnella sp. WGS1546 TaxID=3366810 RepID=UPI00372D682C